MTLNGTRIVANLFLVGLMVGGCQSLDAPVGWRTDGTGIYGRARAPLQWSDQENVVWATEMPSWSNSMPIIVGDRLFVCSEPTSLVCLRRSDGKILWQRDNSTLELLTATQAEKLRAELKQAEPQHKELQEIKEQIRRTERTLKKDPENESLKKDLQVLQDKKRELEEELAPLEPHILSGKSHPAWGFSSATPVSDGRNVYVMFGNSVAASYDLDGNRQWINRVDPWIGLHSTSPLLVGNKLLVHAAHLVALNKTTGEELWRSDAIRRYGTPVHTRIGNVDVIATAYGDLIRVEDGEKLAEGLGELKYNSPIVQDGMLCYSQGDTLAWKLPAGGTSFKPKLLWHTQIKKHRYYASPVFHQGLIYSLSIANVLSVIDAENGQLVYEQNLDLGKGDAFPSLCVAGGYVFVSNSNGTTRVLKPGRKYEPVGMSRLEEFRSSLVFERNRLYVRGLKHLYCIAGSRDRN